VIDIEGRIGELEMNRFMMLGGRDVQVVTEESVGSDPLH